MDHTADHLTVCENETNGSVLAIHSLKRVRSAAFIVRVNSLITLSELCAVVSTFQRISVRDLASSAVTVSLLPVSRRPGQMWSATRNKHAAKDAACFSRMGAEGLEDTAPNAGETSISENGGTTGGTFAEMFPSSPSHGVALFKDLLSRECGFPSIEVVRILHAAERSGLVSPVVDG